MPKQTNTQALNTIDGVLVQWGDRLFYAANRAVPGRTPALTGPAVHARAAQLRQRLRATVVHNAPQVMVKITGGGRGMGAIAAHLRYIGKAGRLPMEDDRGVTREGKDALRDLVEQWRVGGSRIPEESHRREAFHLMLSMPTGTSASAVHQAARAFAKAEFSNHRYAMVLHTHQANPHVHLSVRAEGRDGQRLNPRKADLYRWRESFAQQLRELGIEAEASPQITRGGNRRTERLWQRKASDAGREVSLRQGHGGRHTGGHRAGHRAGQRHDQPKLTRSRHEAAQAWCEIAKALASSDDIDDRRLSAAIVGYARHLPGVRWRSAAGQQEIQGLERPTSARSTPSQQQRPSPEPEIER